MPTWPDDHPAARRRTAGPPPGCPLPRSTELAGLEFTGRYATYEAADTWHPTWAADGSEGGSACGSKGLLAATGPSRFLSDDGRTGWLLDSGNYTDHWGHPEDPDQVVVADPPGTSYAMVLQEFLLLDA